MIAQAVERSVPAVSYETPPPASMFTRVLVPVDDTPASRHAADMAARLAAACGADVVLLSVIASDDATSPAKTAAAAGALAATANRLVARGVDVQTELVAGDVVEEMLLAAAMYRADLIVMGTHARAQTFVPALGSTTATALRRSTVPILVVR